MQVIRVEDGIECELVRSQPTLVGVPYEITVISDVPADSATMHNKLVLAPLGDVIELTEEPSIDEEAVYLEDTGGALHVRSVRRWVSGWEATDGD